MTKKKDYRVKDLKMSRRMKSTESCKLCLGFDLNPENKGKLSWNQGIPHPSNVIS